MSTSGSSSTPEHEPAAKHSDKEGYEGGVFDQGHEHPADDEGEGVFDQGHRHATGEHGQGVYEQGHNEPEDPKRQGQGVYDQGDEE